ncbi:UNVERIFIED_CONTAM: hypothetical protein HDU68_007609 [Siphonaria sp. JEL0065]|nr:hypothetical protein HDU68_007609 [Siphonaria sp. JEL0065]
MVRFKAPTGTQTSPVPTGPPVPPKPVSCPSFLLPNPAYNVSNPSQVLPEVLGRQCNGPCCVPCPAVHQFYDPHDIASLNIFNQVMILCSFFGASFMVISYIVFPAKRTHPGTIMWFFSLGTFLYHLFQLTLIGSDGYRVTCIDPITEAHQQSSPLCATQAFIQTFAAMYLIFWVNMFMLNLHLSIVWRKDWFTDRYIYIRIASLIYAIVPAVLALAMGTGASIGFSCLVDVEHVQGLILIPMGVIGGPGVGLTLFTVLYLIKVLMSAPGAKNTATERSAVSGAGNSTLPGGGVGSKAPAPPMPSNTTATGGDVDAIKLEHRGAPNRMSGMMERSASGNHILERAKSIVAEKGTLNPQDSKYVGYKHVHIR